MTEKHAIITGAHGFLGRHVAKVFSDNGFSVLGLGHGRWSKLEWQKWGLSEWHCCDITLDNLSRYAKKPGVVIHCAGSGSVEYSMTHPSQDFEKTVTTTISVLEFLRLYSPESTLIYPSSVAVYGTVEQLPISESASLNPISPYGVHKKIVEELCQSYVNNFKIRIAIIRFFSLYGRDLRKQLLWDACRKVTKDDLTFYGTGNEIRDWIHVTDAARLILTLTSHTSTDMPIVNGGSGTGTKVSDVINRIIFTMGKNGIPRFSQQQKAGDPVGYIADTSKSFGYGWTPKVKMKKGIDEYVQWFLTGAL
jgi:UDP-glucose 4-epimerase